MIITNKIFALRLVKLLVIVCFLFAGNEAFSQMIKDNSKWTFEAKKKGGNKYELIVHLKLPKGWHIYAPDPGGDGTLIPTKIIFNKTKNVNYVGGLIEKGKLISKTIDGTDGIVHEYLDSVDFIQLATVTGSAKISGSYSYSYCNEDMCLPPRPDKNFTINVDPNATTSKDTIAAVPDVAVGTNAGTTPSDSPTVEPVATKIDTGANGPTSQRDAAKSVAAQQQKSLLWLFFAALLGGLAAVLTPCVYSMIPITVSFFTKRSKTRAEGIRNALYYSLSIIIIFTVLGVLVSAIFGATALNALSTNWIANLFFFVVFVIFGISFLGAFEITLPSSWTSKTDSRAGVGSFSGIFFMALTLAIVSFSCTGPIVGPLLVAAGKGGKIGPMVGMFGFSVGLSLPFALFAIFPGMLNKMASSGGWMNQVKVVLGLVELMLALKFLSNADLSQGWRLLDREIFIALWVVLSVLIGVYLLGKLKLSHDDKPAENIYGQEYVSILKLFMAIGAFTFAVYLLPGMWGAPLNGMGGFIPPMGTFEPFGGGVTGLGAENAVQNELSPQKYTSELKMYEPPVVRSLGLVTYYDYNEAVAISKKLKKPIMLDFTGINCSNCRKMESQVWSKPEVAKRLKDDFVVVSLYCDLSKIVLPKDQQYFSKDLNTQVVTLGDKNADLQASKFGANTQPYYFFVDENGVKLAEEGYSYNPDVEKFVSHLDKVKQAYRKTHP